MALLGKRRSFCIVALLALALPAWGAQEKAPSEYEVKAAYLFNFAKFTEWPAAAFPHENASIVLGVLGKDPFGGFLDRTFAGQKLGSRCFEIRRGARLEEIGPCHILFICDSESDRLEGILEGLRTLNVLTVSDIEKFAASGGTLGFVMDEKKVRFEANPEAAQRAGLKLSSKLLKLARVVKGK